MINPSAKYDASGAGVINFITKKNKKDGWNGWTALNLGARNKYASSLSLSRHGKATWKLGYDGGNQTTYRTRSGQTAVLPAPYLTYAQQLAHDWNAQSDLQVEGTFLSGGRAAVSKHDVDLFPSATVAHELGKEQVQNRLQFSYARCLNRPDFMQQLPIQLHQDPRNYRQGNPTCCPSSATTSS